MSERAGLPLSIIMIDNDHFKQINDGFGHAAGDKTLIEVAKTLRSNLRQDDHVYRIGGEEFLLLSSLSDIKQLIVAAERLRRHIAALRIDYQGQSIQVSISLGLARREASHQHYDALLSSADTALYAAKSGGRNRICYSRLQEIHDLGSSSVRGAKKQFLIFSAHSTPGENSLSHFRLDDPRKVLTDTIADREVAGQRHQSIRHKKAASKRLI